MTGWNLTLEYGISAATVGQGWSYYLYDFLIDVGVDKKYLPMEFFGRNIDSALTVNIGGGIIVLMCTFFIIFGVRESARLTNIMTVWNMLLIVFFIVAGCFYVDTTNWFEPCNNSAKYDTKCSSDESNNMMPYGFAGVMQAAGIVFFSYVGFDQVSALAEETKNPNKDMIWGILGL